MIVGFLLAISYKSVLRAMLMKTYYEDTIDTIDDMLDSTRQFFVQSDISGTPDCSHLILDWKLKNLQVEFTFISMEEGN